MVPVFAADLTMFVAVPPSSLAKKMDVPIPPIIRFRGPVRVVISRYWMMTITKDSKIYYGYDDVIG